MNMNKLAKNKNIVFVLIVFIVFIVIWYYFKNIKQKEGFSALLINIPGGGLPPTTPPIRRHNLLTYQGHQPRSRQRRLWRLSGR